MKFSELHRRLERAGWFIVKETDHRYYGHNEFPYLIKVGRHGSKEVPPNQFYKVVKAAGLKP
ncbi:MAG: type II toxin-antitoxin system HicA family toxin [Marinilabiliaceae bacterium]|nr:type II toxin-antitoxin system HicA family toxin [Marinilabiliaceae bacterium]